MGLRLYQPPVESDIKSKPSADKIFSRARSLIGRSRVSASSEQPREQRRRRILAGLDSRRRSPPLDVPTDPPAASDTTGQADNTESGRHVLRNMASRMGVLDERVVAMFGERWAHLHAESNSPLRDDGDDDDPYQFYIPAGRTSLMAVEPDFLERRRPRLPTEPYTVSSMRSTQAPPRSSRSPARSSLGAHVRRAVRDRNTPRHPVGADIAAYRAELLSRRRRRHDESQPSPELAQVDGLGDRNRSLSPEDDTIWDTMLTTLTPDPHPPSIGSSFASTTGSASAAASQSAATRSSATSFTGPDTIEESALEQPCDSGCETSDTEALEGEEGPNLFVRMGLRNDQPTYADVVSSTRSNSFDDTLDSIGDVRGMQRIVRRLANRDDIPDEWWAQVGLSRTLSREASANERD